MIDIARALGMDVVAEGVETDPQRLQLLSMGCVRMQGHYFCAPIVADAIVDLPQAASLTLSSRALASL